MPHHRLAIRIATTFGSHHMIEETTHAITYFDSPFKAILVALGMLAHHRIHTSSH